MNELLAIAKALFGIQVALAAISASLPPNEILIIPPVGVSGVETDNIAQKSRTTQNGAVSSDWDGITRIVWATSTGYTSDPKETDSTPTITASGSTTHKGTAACPTLYPFGTRFRIGKSEYVCEDRTHPKNNGIWDLWFGDKQEALNWGRRAVVVSIFYIP